MKLQVLYEDSDLVVVWKPVGVESQTSRGFGADMVSMIKNHLVLEARRASRLQTAAASSAPMPSAHAQNISSKSKLSTSHVDKPVQKSVEPYVGVIHRLDKPVSGIMVYAKSQKSAAFLSSQVSGKHDMDKKYMAVLCGNVDKLVDNPVDNLVDYLLKDDSSNTSRIVDKGISGAKYAELSYRIPQTIQSDVYGPLALAEITLHTGRHHQIRVQMSGHGLPLWGDQKYNPAFQPSGIHGKERCNIGLASCELAFEHPSTHKTMRFRQMPEGGIFSLFNLSENKYLTD